ncbi:unnamed protein product, partial [marine sediment metagenome]
MRAKVNRTQALKQTDLIGKLFKKELRHNKTAI